MSVDSSSLADFTITVHEGRKPMAVRVIVHEDVHALRKAAMMHYNRWKGRTVWDVNLEACLGVCHRFHIANDPVLAVVRLAPPNLGAGIVAHELLHAMTWLWQIENKFKDVPLTCENDEWFAWALGELVRCTHNQLWDNGLYS